MKQIFCARLPTIVEWLARWCETNERKRLWDSAWVFRVWTSLNAKSLKLKHALNLRVLAVVDFLTSIFSPYRALLVYRALVNITMLAH